MEEDILNYSPTVMFRETPCSKLLILLAEIGDLEKRNT